MTHRHLGDDTAGVTPVIGIILMISITVLLAATVGAFVMGLDDEAEQNSAPTVAIEFDYSAGTSDELQVMHNTGHGLDPDQTYVVLSDAKCSSGADPNGRYEARTDFGETQEIAAGMSLTVSTSDLSNICSGSDLDLSQATVRVVWTAAEGTNSHTLSTWHGPAASY